nr:MAG TPA: hypothetical protein [Caudoviricetes sp.]
MRQSQITNQVYLLMAQYKKLNNSFLSTVKRIFQK